MAEELSTAVSTESASIGDTASSVAPAPGGVSEATSSVPAQPDAAVAAAPTVEDIIGSLPENDDDLNEPTVTEADRTYRSHVRVLADSYKSLQPLKGYESLIGKATPELVQNRMEMFEGLFAPVVNQLTQRPERDPATGQELYTTLPFIEKANEMNPGLPEQLMADLSQFRVMNPRLGQEEMLWQTFTRDVLGLDPERLKDYRSIDTLLAGSSAAITQDELAAIPEQFREAYKTLPASVRDNLMGMDEEARDYFLEERQWKVDREREQREQKHVEQQQQAQKQAELQQWLTSEQDKYVAGRRQEGYAEIRNALAQQVTFSGDEKTNNLMLSLCCLLPTALIDPDLGFGTEAVLKELGVELNGFYDTASTVMSSLRDYKAHELGGLKLQADAAMAKAYGPEAQMKAKLSDIALKTAMALGAQRQSKSAQRDTLLNAATSTRPSPTTTIPGDVAQSPLPPGVRADSAEANRIMWQRANAGR